MTDDQTSALPDELADFRLEVRHFCQTVLAPEVDRHEARGEFPRSLYEAMAAEGLLGLPIPASGGGSGRGFLALALAAEEVSRIHPALTAAFNMNCATVPLTIWNWGSEDLRDRYVRPLITAEWIGYFGLTEAGSGTDVLGSVRSTAVRDGDQYVINGTKMFTTLASEAQTGIMFVRTGSAAEGHRALTAFVVDTATPGFTSRVIPTSSLGSLMPTCSVRMRDVRVPVANRIGNEGDGFRIAMSALGYGRLTVASRSLGLGQACLDLASKYANRRKAFGQPIANYQLVKRLFADTAVEVTATRHLVWAAARRMDQHLPAGREVSYAKYFAGEMSVRAAQAVFEVFGGYAVIDRYPVARYLNYAHLFKLGEGSANLQRILIANDALGLDDLNRHQPVFRTA